LVKVSLNLAPTCDRRYDREERGSQLEKKRRGRREGRERKKSRRVMRGGKKDVP